jgi:hypothetical protein
MADELAVLCPKRWMESKEMLTNTISCFAMEDMMLMTCLNES